MAMPPDNCAGRAWTEVASPTRPKASMARARASPALTPASASGRAERSIIRSRPDPAGGDFAADLNPNSLEVLNDSRVEPALAAGNTAEAVQFERQGYFCRDQDSAPGRPVFNRTVGLRDTWAKVSAGGKG